MRNRDSLICKQSQCRKYVNSNSTNHKCKKRDEKHRSNFAMDDIYSDIRNIPQNFDILATQVLLVVTDSGSAMHCAGRLLKFTSPNLLQETCILRGLHLVAETSHHCCPYINELIAQTNEYLSNLPNELFISVASNDLRTFN